MISRAVVDGVDDRGRLVDVGEGAVAPAGLDDHQLRVAAEAGDARRRSSTEPAASAATKVPWPIVSRTSVAAGARRCSDDGDLRARGRARSRSAPVSITAIVIALRSAQHPVGHRVFVHGGVLPLARGAPFAATASERRARRASAAAPRARRQRMPGRRATPRASADVRRRPHVRRPAARGSRRRRRARDARASAAASARSASRSRRRRVPLRPRGRRPGDRRRSRRRPRARGTPATLSDTTDRHASASPTLRGPSANPLGAMRSLADWTARFD